jgi:quercetin dioxygenase-like cupin family protein
MGQAHLNDCPLPAYVQGGLPQEEAFAHSAAVRSLAMSPSILAGVQELMPGRVPVLWATKLVTRHPLDIHLWHMDQSSGDELPAFHPDHVGCYRDSVTVLLSVENMSPESSLYVVEGSESIPRDDAPAVPSAVAGCARAGLPKQYCASLHQTIDFGTFWSCRQKGAHEADLKQACEQRVADLLGRQTDELLACVRRYDPSARVRKLEQRDFEFSAFRSPTLHSTAHLGNRTRVALQFQYVARGCPVRLPTTHAFPRAAGFDTAHPNRLAMTLDSGGAHAGGAAEDPSAAVIAMQPAALAGLDLANLDLSIGVNVTAARSTTDYLRKPGAPWRREVLVLDGGAAGARTPADHNHNMWGALHVGKDLAASQTCHLSGFDITTMVGAWGVPPHPLHFHDRDVHELCWQHNGTVQYEFTPLAARLGKGRHRADGERVGAGSLAVWEGTAGTVTYLPSGEGHRYRCAGDGARMAGDNVTVEFVRRPCMVTCVKLVPRPAPAPQCVSMLSGLEPMNAGSAALRVGVVSDALGWLDRNMNQRRARRGDKMGLNLYTPLLRGINVDGSRVHVHVDDYLEGVTLAAHADSYDVFLAVVRGACWVRYDKGQGKARRAVERQIETGNIVLKPAGANLTITTRKGQTARILVLEVAAGEKTNKASQRKKSKP